MGIVQAIPEIGHSTGHAIMRINEDTRQDMGRNRADVSENIHEAETTHGVKTVNDMEPTFDRIEEKQ
jgi:hypothetical protein